MNRVQEEWEKMRIAYQQRYVTYLKEYDKDNTDKYAQGHLLECSWVLHEVYGLTDKQVSELEHNYSGLTNEDIGD